MFALISLFYSQLLYQMAYKKCLISFLLLVLFQSINGQFGLRLKYNNNNYEEWQTAVGHRFGQDKKLFSPGFEAGIDYWFRLKKRRIEFLPEVSYKMALTNYGTSELDKLSLSGINFNFHTQIYALDLEGDCNCPTFSKQGPSINKGLFFHFTPGLGYFAAKASVNGDPPTEFKDKASGLVFRAGIGAGMDIGLSDLITVTPVISYYFHSGMTWEKLDARPNDLEIYYPDSTVNPSQLQFTLRFGFRPDYSRGRRR